MNFQLAALLGYSVLLVAVGLFISRRVSRASDFLVAGRSLGPGLVFATFLAANSGAGSTVGAAAIGYSSGLSAWWWVGFAGIGSIVLAWVVGPKIWAIAKAHNLETVGDYLEFRYGRPARGIAAMSMWLVSLAALAAQLIAISTIMTAIVGTPQWVGAVVGGLVVMAYFSAGGLLSSAWVNGLQLVIMLAGFVFAVPYALSAAGGGDAVAASIASQMTDEAAQKYFSLTGIGLRGIFGYFMILVPSFIISPGLLQKAFGARDQRAVRIGISLNAAGLLIFAAMPPILGMVARARFPDLASGQLALPTVMLQLLPPWLGLLALAAVFSAEVSTCDAILFMLSSSLSVDLYKGFIKPQASQADVLRVSRLAAVAGTIFGVTLSLVLPSIIEALSLFYGLMTVVLLVPLIGGLYFRRPTLNAAVRTMLVSLAVTLFVYFATGGVGYGVLQPYAIGLIAGVVVMLRKH